MARGGGSALEQLARRCTYPGAGTQSSAAGAVPNRGVLQERGEKEKAQRISHHTQYIYTHAVIMHTRSFLILCPDVGYKCTNRAMISPEIIRSLQPKVGDYTATNLLHSDLKKKNVLYMTAQKPQTLCTSAARWPG